MKTRPPFKIQGGKFPLVDWIVRNFPEQYETLDYLEPYAGAGSVFFNKVQSKSREVINDLDPGVIAIMKALRDEGEAFVKKLRNTTYSERVFLRELKASTEPFETEFDYAVNEFVIRRMSRGGMKKAFSLSERNEVNTWEAIIKTLPELSERLKDVFIFNKPAIQVINAFNYKDILVYCDPPYVPETKANAKTDDVEMETDAHIALADALSVLKGKVI